MFIQPVKHYHQWLRTAIPFKTKSGQIPSDSVRIQGPSKRPSSGHLYLVSSVKECNRKGGKCKISLRHHRVSECDGRPSVQVEPSAVNRMVTASAGVQTDLSKVVHSSCRSICHSSEPQTSSVRISRPRPKCLGHRCSELKLDRSHFLCLPSDGSPSQGDPKNQAIPFPDHLNSPRLARDALVLGPSAALNRDPTATSGVNNSSQTVPQLCISQQSTSQPPRLVSRSGQLQEQGFSVAVAERIAAPQRSTRTIYKSKWALFEKWYRENLVDFSTPSVK